MGVREAEEDSRQGGGHAPDLEAKHSASPSWPWNHPEILGAGIPPYLLNEDHPGVGHGQVCLQLSAGELGIARAETY